MVKIQDLCYYPPMQQLQELLTNPEILHTYALADNSLYYVEHNINHALRVMHTAQALATKLKLSATDIENVGIAGLLHDLGASNLGKDGHAERSYEMAKRYTNNEKILDAIREHSKGHPSDYGYILTLADKLDFCCKRLTELGKTIEGVRQWEHLRTMDFDIVDRTLIINVTSDKKLDLQELNAYYFTPKIANVIKNFANHFNLKYMVYLDNEPWQTLC